MGGNSIQLFDNRQIRTQWDVEREKMCYHYDKFYNFDK